MNMTRRRKRLDLLRGNTFKRNRNGGFCDKEKIGLGVIQRMDRRRHRRRRRRPPPNRNRRIQ